MSTLPSFPDFPATPDDMTAAWLSAALHANDVNAEVASFTQQRIGTGQIGQNVRFTLTYASGAPATAPKTLVGKFVSPDPTSRGTGLALGIYAKEALFYRDFAPQLDGKMRVARCWAAEFDASREATLLLMEDLAPAVQGDQMLGCSVEEVDRAVVQLAALHATFWLHPALTTTDELSDPKDPVRAGFVTQLMEMYWPAFIDRYADRLRADHIEVGHAVVNNLEEWILQRNSPTTLVHGDYRADNLMIGPGFSAAVDWQTLAIGYGGVDLGYFLGASMLPDARRRHERRLVADWYRIISDAGISNFTIDDAWDDYRHGQFAGFVTAVVSSMITERTDRGDEMFWTMADRHLTTALDTNAVELLPG
jgi:Ecdysteroid kinase-like family